MDNQMKNSRKKLFIVIGIFIGLVLLMIALYVYTTLKNDDGKLTISNLSSYTKVSSSNKEKIDYIQYDLFRVVNLNSDTSVSSNSIKDIVIRDKSFSEKYNEEIKTHTVTFIVDIKSLKQSYDVSYQWVDPSSDTQEVLDEYGTVVKCLPKEKLVYGDFGCEDMFTVLSTPSDPILNHLPYSSENFEVVYDPRATKTLSVTIKTSASDERSGGDAAIERYKVDVKTWLATVTKNPEDYTVNFTLVRASLY
ncbi:MAG: hypothetical protein ABIQ64_02310 [Candidatus Saccharimonadales bacterium]